MSIRRIARKLPRIRSWSIRSRRIFLLTLPVSLPLRVAATILFYAAKNIRDCVRALVRPVLQLWTAPPVKRYGYGYYGEERHFRYDEGKRDSRRRNHPERGKRHGSHLLFPAE